MYAKGNKRFHACNSYGPTPDTSKADTSDK